MTRETVAGESARCSAKNFKLTDRAEVFPRGGEDATVFARIMGCFVAVVWHNGVAAASGNAKFFANVAACPVKFKTNTRKIDLSWTVLVLCIQVFPYIPLDTAARLGVS
jgi:hypothetical protein